MTGATQHEAHHVDTRALRRIGIWAAMAFTVVLIVMYAWWRQMPKPSAPRAVAASGARLQAHAPSDRERVLAAQRLRLMRYRWTDGSHRYAQVPIERAMTIIADDAAHPAREARP